MCQIWLRSDGRVEKKRGGYRQTKITAALYSRLAGYPASLGKKGGREGRGGRVGGEGGKGREGREGWRGRKGWRGGREGPERSSGSLPHCLLYFLKLYNVGNDNVQSIR